MAFKHLPQLFYIILFNPKASTVVTYSITNYSFLHFRSVVWLNFIRPFGAFPFGRLDAYRYFFKKDFKGIK